MRLDRSDIWSMAAILAGGVVGVAVFGPQNFDEWTETKTTTTTIYTNEWVAAPEAPEAPAPPDAPGLVIVANGADAGVEPLIYVDGIRVDEMPDLDPNDIDRVEIVKGSGAVAAFGPEASVGVVQIFLKVEDPADPGR